MENAKFELYVRTVVWIMRYSGLTSSRNPKSVIILEKPIAFQKIKR
jgi:hypothetical protein